MCIAIVLYRTLGRRVGNKCIDSNDNKSCPLNRTELGKMVIFPEHFHHNIWQSEQWDSECYKRPTRCKNFLGDILRGKMVTTRERCFVMVTTFFIKCGFMRNLKQQLIELWRGSVSFLCPPNPFPSYFCVECSHEMGSILSSLKWCYTCDSPFTHASFHLILQLSSDEHCVSQPIALHVGNRAKGMINQREVVQ